MDLPRRRAKIQTVLLVLVVALPISVILFFNTVLQFIALPIATAILVLVWVLHDVHVKEDKARGDCKGRNRVGWVQLSGVVLGLTGINLAYDRWESLSATNPATWLWVLLASFFVLCGVICLSAGAEYNRTIDRLEEYEAHLTRLGYERDESGRLYPASLTEDDEHQIQ